MQMPPEARLPDKCEACGQLIEPASEAAFTVDGLLIRPGFRTVEFEGKTVRLSEQKYRLLVFLLRRRSARKEAIYTAVFERFDRDGPDPKIVDVAICQLRNKLAEVGAGGMIKTIWGRGYAMDPDNISFAMEMGRKPKDGLAR